MLCHILTLKVVEAYMDLIDYPMNEHIYESACDDT